MPDTTLPNTGLTSILVGGSENTWGDKVDANFVIIDNLFSNTTGHDHSGAGKGKPIPPVGLKSLTNAMIGVVAAKGDGTFMLATAAAGTSGLAISNVNAISVDLHGLTAKATPVDADEFMIADSAAAFVLKKVTRSALLTGAVLAGTPYGYNAIGAANGAVAFAVNTYTVFSWTPNGTSTITPSGMVAGKAYLMAIKITNGGSFTVNDPASTRWPGGARPALSPAGSDWLYYISLDGATWDGAADIDVR